MGTMIINGKPVEFTDEKNVLAVIHNAGIDLPTLCYYSELSTYGACRMCVVEDKRGRISASCSMEPQDGLEIVTNSARLLRYRRTIIELLLASHDCNCPTCEKNGDCRLQDLGKRYGIRGVRFEDTRKPRPVDMSSHSIVLNPNKCILCGDCVRTCSEIQGLGIIDFIDRGAKVHVGPAFNAQMINTKCISCGQCAAICPTNAISVKHNLTEVWNAIFDPDKRVVAQIAPAVRVAIGEHFNFNPGKNQIGKIVAALKALGFDVVADTVLSADLTVMEESAELLERLDEGGPFPLFTSCCPAWVKYVENYDPSLIPNVSTCKSPMSMFSPVLKKYYDNVHPNSTRKTVNVAVMPCAAKKMEAKRDEFKTEGIPDTDIVITTNELINMIEEAGINFDLLESTSPDMPMGLGSGAGLIFGATGGVAEAVVRRCMNINKQYLSEEKIELKAVRGFESVKEAEITVGDQVVHVAVVHGMNDAQQLIRQIKSGERFYHIVEVMACKGGCVGGAGQPYGMTKDKLQRAQGLYSTDKKTGIRSSDENPMINFLYDNVIREKRHEMLHVHYQHE